VAEAIKLDGKKSAVMKRKLRVTYAKKEEKKAIRAITGNADAARTRLTKKESSGKSKTLAVIEGKRARKSNTGTSGFKLGKKRGKMRLVERK
jgi:hypothetical protein